MLDSARASPVDEKPRGITPLGRILLDELRWKVVVELGSVHPARRVASARMDALALERAKQRIADAASGRSAPADIEAALVRSREQVEALAAAAAELEASIPAHVGSAVRDGLRTEVLPVARHIAEIRGLLNQAIRRLERLEGDILAERLHQENGAEPLSCSQATRRPRERLPPPVVQALDEKHLDRRAR